MNERGHSQDEDESPRIVHIKEPTDRIDSVVAPPFERVAELVLEWALRYAHHHGHIDSMKGEAIGMESFSRPMSQCTGARAAREAYGPTSISYKKRKK
jgi:hypothetical protein